MTPQERENEKQLITEAKNRSESEEENIFIRSEGAPGKQRNSKGTQTTNSEGGERRGGGRILNNNRKTQHVNIGRKMLPH